jgi:hypothetical protein
MSRRFSGAPSAAGPVLPPPPRSEAAPWRHSSPDSSARSGTIPTIPSASRTMPRRAGSSAPRSRRRPPAAAPAPRARSRAVSSATAASSAARSSGPRALRIDSTSGTGSTGIAACTRAISASASACGSAPPALPHPVREGQGRPEHHARRSHPVRAPPEPPPAIAHREPHGVPLRAAEPPRPLLPRRDEHRVLEHAVVVQRHGHEDDVPPGFRRTLHDVAQKPQLRRPIRPSRLSPPSGKIA